MAEYRSGKDGQGYSLKMIVEQTSQSVSGNYSDVRVRLYLENGWTTFAEYNITASVTCDGQRQDYSGRPEVLTANSSRLFIDRTFRVNHNSDGRKSVTVSANFNGSGGWSPAALSIGGQNFGLSTIPRASSFTLAGATEFGQVMTINITRAAANFTHTLRVHFGNHQSTIATGVGTSTTWTPPLTLCQQIPSATSGRGTIWCDTYSGSTKIGESAVVFTLNVPASVVPTFSGVTLTDGNATAGALVTGNNFVEIISDIAVTFNGATGVHASTITGYHAEIVGKSQSTSSQGGRLGSMKFDGAATIRAKVQDSRGRWSATRDVSITVLDYHPPILSFTTARVGAAASTIQVYRNARIAPLTVGGVQKNSMTLTFKIKEVTATAYQTDTGAAGGTFNTQSQLTNSAASLGGVYPSTKSYDVLATLSDKFTSTEFAARVSTEAVIFSYDKDGRFGVGKIPEIGKVGSLEVAGDIYAGGNKIQMHALTSGDPALGRIKWDNTTHLDDIVGSGYYWVSKGTPTNGWGVLEVYRVADKETAQFFTSSDGGKTFARLKHYQTGVWSVWKTRGLDQFYPVGSIYQSTNSTDPTSLMGGTWKRFGQGRVLVGVSETETEFNVPNKAGGSKVHTLTIQEMPSHSHRQRVTANNGSPAIRRDHASDGNSSIYDQGIDTGSTGGGQPHNNLQPYITVYMWERIA